MSLIKQIKIDGLVGISGLLSHNFLYEYPWEKLKAICSIYNNGENKGTKLNKRGYLRKRLSKEEVI